MWPHLNAQLQCPYKSHNSWICMTKLNTHKICDRSFLLSHKTPNCVDFYWLYRISPVSGKFDHTLIHSYNSHASPATQEFATYLNMSRVCKGKLFFFCPHMKLIAWIPIKITGFHPHKFAEQWKIWRHLNAQLQCPCKSHNSWIFMTKLNLSEIFQGNLLLSHKTPDRRDYYWNYWISPAKIHRTMVNGTVT